jgi:stress response protein YsnF
MTIIDIPDTNPWIGRTVVDLDGVKLGALERVFADAGTASWLVVARGDGLTYIPANMAQAFDGTVHVPYSIDMVASSPSSQFDQARLLRHYGLNLGPVVVSADEYDAWPEPPAHAPEPQPAAPPEDVPVTPAASSNAADDATIETAEPTWLPEPPAASSRLPEPMAQSIVATTDDELVRWEEEMVVDVQRVERGRIRIRKVIITEDVQITVPVRREVARVVFEPVGANGQFEPDEEIEREIVLHEEIPIVTTKFVPRERLRIEIDTVSRDAPVTARLRRERFELDSDLEEAIDQINR